MARANTEINASSMADIAFLLLIFYLVTTTMNTDQGIMRILPPIADEQSEAPDIKERNALLVRINQFNAISVAGQRVDVSQIKEIAKKFILNPANDPTLPEFEEAEVPLLGKVNVSKGVISLQNDINTTYEVYVQVQNELTKAYNEAQNELANAKFSKNYDKLEEAQQTAIRKAIPNRISEAEPRDLSKKK